MPFSNGKLNGSNLFNYGFRNKFSDNLPFNTWISYRGCPVLIVYYNSFRHYDTIWRVCFEFTSSVPLPEEVAPPLASSTDPVIWIGTFEIILCIPDTALIESFSWQKILREDLYIFLLECCIPLRTYNNSPTDQFS